MQNLFPESCRLQYWIREDGSSSRRQGQHCVGETTDPVTLCSVSWRGTLRGRVCTLKMQLALQSAVRWIPVGSGHGSSCTLILKQKQLWVFRRIVRGYGNLSLSVPQYSKGDTPVGWHTVFCQTRRRNFHTCLGYCTSTPFRPDPSYGPVAPVAGEAHGGLPAGGHRRGLSLGLEPLPGSPAVEVSDLGGLPDWPLLHHHVLRARQGVHDPAPGSLPRLAPALRAQGSQVRP